MARVFCSFLVVLCASMATGATLLPSVASAWDTRAYHRLLRTHKCRRCNLKEISLRGAALIGADLRKANLRDADMSSTILKRARLQGADLRGVDFTDANLEGAKLDNARTQGAIFCLTIMPGGATNNKGCKKAK